MVRAFTVPRRDALFRDAEAKARAISRAEKYDFRAISWNNGRERRGNAASYARYSMLNLGIRSALLPILFHVGKGETIRKLMVLRVVITEE